MSFVVDIQTVTAVLGVLGIGGIIGGYFQHIWTKNRETQFKLATLKEERYRTCLVYMRLFLNPDMKDVFVNIPKIDNKDEMKEFSRKQIIAFRDNSILFASSQVINKINEFLDDANEEKLFKTAEMMGIDSWKKSF